MSSLPELDQDDRQELRCAVVMTGGVSLAVWMAGVTLEIRRLVSADEAWGDLLDLMGTTAVVDIVSGTSAGGINGALLAAATVSDLDVAKVAEMRDTWLELGSLGALLRDRDEVEPSSLMKGDDYLLPEMARVLRDWLAPSRRIAAERDPAQDSDLVLLLTASLLDGEPRIHRDDVGSLLSETEHLALFRFDGASLRRPSAENQLAVAARTSASYPGAFEASYLSVDDTPGKVDVGDVVDLATNRWAVDGGVVMNQPIQPALEAMYAQPARNETRRVLLSVEPDPGPRTEPPAAQAADAPSVRRVLGRSMLDLPKQQSIAADLALLRATNDRVETQQRVRRELVHEAALVPGSLTRLAGSLYPVHVARRNSDLGTRLSNRIAAQSSRLAIEARFDWRAVERQMDRAAFRSTWLPEPPADRAALPTVAVEDWPWGIASVEYAVSTIGDLIRRVQHAMSLAADDIAADRRAELRSHRALLNRIRRDLAALRSLSDHCWNVRVLSRHGRSDTLTAGWADEAFATWPVVDEIDLARAAVVDAKAVVAYRRAFDDVVVLAASARGDLNGGVVRRHQGYLAAWLATLVTAAAPTLSAVLDRAGSAAARDLRDLVDVLAPPSGVEGRAAIDHVTTRLVELFVVQSAVDAETTTREQTAELIQISADAESPLDPTRIVPAEKLAGAQAMKFGAFYKRSWRANDWTWGRLDGSARLARVVLEPRRLAQRLAHIPVADRVETALAAIGSVVTDPASPSAADLAAHWQQDRSSVAEELSWLASDDPEVPGGLPLAVRAVTRRLHHDILHDELPRLAASVEESRLEGGAVSSQAARFRRLVQDVEVGGAVPGNAIHRLFDAWQIGQERLADERDTPLFVATLTRIAAISTAGGAGPRSTLGLLRLPLRPLAWALRTVDRAVARFIAWRA